MKFKLLPAALTALLIASPVLAADAYTIDPTHTWVTFKTNHGTWSHAHGIFHTVSGTIAFDKADVTKSSVEITVDTTSLDTNDKQRDSDLNSPDFLNTAEFPEMTFKSTAIEKTGDKTARVTGDLTLLGTTKPVTLDVIFNAEAPVPWDTKTVKIGFSATGSINGPEFGITKMNDFGLGPDINLDIDLEAAKQ